MEFKSQHSSEAIWTRFILALAPPRTVITSHAYKSETWGEGTGERGGRGERRESIRISYNKSFGQTSLSKLVLLAGDSVISATVYSKKWVAGFARGILNRLQMWFRSLFLTRYLVLESPPRHLETWLHWLCLMRPINAQAKVSTMQVFYMQSNIFAVWLNASRDEPDRYQTWSLKSATTTPSDLLFGSKLTQSSDNYWRISHHPEDVSIL